MLEQPNVDGLICVFWMVMRYEVWLRVLVESIRLAWLQGWRSVLWTVTGPRPVRL